MQLLGHLKEKGNYFSNSLNEKANWRQSKLKTYSNSQFSLLASFPSNYKSKSTIFCCNNHF